ncbi:hypothetical protein HYU16_00185 [Candidatus Woesearchaeota archaeon]|nr:hypothetical protein [Candidatus Woesearchaeota archaeon]
MKKRSSLKKAQTWSTDAIVGVVLFFIAVVLLYYLTGPISENRQTAKLQADADKLPSILGTSQNLTGTFIDGAKVDVGKLATASNASYENLKSLLGIESEFCIYFEDEKGNIVPMQGDRAGIGSPLVNISGKGCNESITG